MWYFKHSNKASLEILDLPGRIISFQKSPKLLLRLSLSIAVKRFSADSILHTVPVDLKAALSIVEKNHPSEFVFPFGKRLRQTAQ